MYKMKKSEIEFTNNEIEDMKNMIEVDELIDSSIIEDLKKLKDKIGNNIALAKLFSLCYMQLYVNSMYFRSDGKDYITKLVKYLSEFEIEPIKRYLDEYADGKEIGSDYTEEAIGNIVKKDREKMMELIMLFFSIFGEE